MSKILVADSGGTKTDWAMVGEEGISFRCTTLGMHPIHLSSSRLREVVVNELLPVLPIHVDVSAIYFYGGGCTPQMCPVVEEALRSCFPRQTEIYVESDLLGAARALCGNSEGIACILGTGANSCLYDGRRIVRNTPPLGYILGDEGSGATLGRLFLNALFKGFLPGSMREEYLAWANTTYAEVIERVYRRPEANRYLASIAPFIRERMPHEPMLEALVADNFRAFFRRNLSPYGDCRQVGFVGGMASAFQDILQEVTEEQGYRLTRICKSPMEGLARYHATFTQFSK